MEEEVLGTVGDLLLFYMCVNGIKLWEEAEYICLLLSTVHYFVFASFKSLSDLFVR